ncbi:peptide chain release factor 1 [Phormidium sp. CLA17]|uniref:peptide chain release factor 1 n=1 Tax=Leptolyngbya sp. Cla-17 TaxID=2803751 RepID=UPI00149224D2|nr:peptide chain release factor 1 [Leptolyngbya sp. Cla-17]MBM0740450.1 peptide chain release factor 1 [Leptolyngbya sp. Cla-17]
MGPIEQFKRLPWRSLTQAAIIVVLVVTLLEFGIAFGLQFPEVNAALRLLFNPPLGLLTECAIAFGLGMLAVIALERMDRSNIRAGSLWGLVLCVVVAFLIKGWLPIGNALFRVEQLQLGGLLVGIFWQGRPYWRSFKQW